MDSDDPIIDTPRGPSGPSYIHPAAFKRCRPSQLQALRKALGDLENAQDRQDGPAASRAADRLCDIAMKLQEHFHWMQRRACTYLEVD